MFLQDARNSTAESSFPHVYGDVPNAVSKPLQYGAFSPRMRGCSRCRDDRIFAIFLFPVYTGMFLQRHTLLDGYTPFPRMYGDVPKIVTETTLLRDFSPYVRGCSRLKPCPKRFQLLFPVYTGMFPGRTHRLPGRRSFPCVCGDVHRHKTGN